MKNDGPGALRGKATDGHLSRSLEEAVPTPIPEGNSASGSRRKIRPPMLVKPTPTELLERVLALGRDIHLGMGEKELAEHFLRALVDMFPGRKVAIRLIGPESNHWQVAISNGARLCKGVEEGPLVVKPSSVKKTKLSQEVVISGRVRVTNAVVTVFEEAGGGFSIPLVAGGDLYGSVDFGYPPGACAPHDDESLLIPIANHLSVALRNVRLHGEAALLRDFLGKLIEHADALIVGIDRSWRVNVFNRAVSRLSGFASCEVMGRDLREWLPPRALSKLSAAIALALSGQDTEPVELSLKTRDGQVVRTVWNVAPIGSDRVVPAVVCVGQDVTRLASLERQVIQAEKLATLGQLAAGVVHELNNPLTSIIAYADFLLKKAERNVPMDPTDRDRLRRILEGAERILNFSRDLVEYARPTGQQLERISLNDVVRQSLSFCEHVLGRRPDLEVKCELEADIPPLFGVRGQLQQVIINLITNAVDAIPPAGGHVAIVTFCPTEHHAAVRVIDNGAGIRPYDLPHIFEPFFTTKTDGKGTGLGLSIVQSIVERHGGTVTVDSAQGQGATFTVLLPSTD
ncbi:MAG: PAS domain S-box protein [Deltaproteobacteria bacterium]|nr:PAS domain S-box protein [Deltaproteobacteria bacterium]